MEDRISDPQERALAKCSRYLSEKYSGSLSIRRVFRTWNEDKDARMSLEELKKMLRVIGIQDKIGDHNLNLALNAILETGHQDRWVQA